MGWSKWFYGTKLFDSSITARTRRFNIKVLNLYNLFIFLGRVTIIRSLEIPLAYTAQIFAFGTFPDKFSILGCLLITCGAVSITLRKIWMQVKANRTEKDEKIQLQS